MATSAKGDQIALVEVVFVAVYMMTRQRITACVDTSAPLTMVVVSLQNLLLQAVVEVERI